MATKGNAASQVNTEAIEAAVVLIRAYIAETKASIDKVNKAVDYLTDENTISGSMFKEYTDLMTASKPAVNIILSKFSKFKELAERLNQFYQKFDAQTNVSFAQANEALKAAAIKMKTVGNK